jgi:hypothetical protein
MSDRLNELQHQRALVQEQLAWLEREIAREMGQPAISSPQASAPERKLPTPFTAASFPLGSEKAPADVETEAEKILARYRHAEHPVKDDVRKGCFLYFALALALLVIAVLMVYFYHMRAQLPAQH